MKKIKLTGGSVTIVDDEDYDFLSQFRWYAVGHDCRLYATWVYDKSKSGVRMHNVIMQPPIGYQVDHINRDGLDNRRCNLRIATPGQNGYNTGPRGASGYKGVSWRKDKRRWRAMISFNRVPHFLGYFRSPEEAARAYDEAAKQFHGEFAYLNFPVYPSRSTNMYL